MCFDEDAIDASGHSGAGDRGQELAVAAARIGAGDPVLADAVRDVEHHGIARLAQVVEGARVHHEVVVAQHKAALGQDDLLVAGALDLLHRLHHVVRCKELPVLQVDHGTGLRGLGHQRGLHAEVGRDLQYIAYLSGGFHLAGIVDVREQRESEFLLHPLQHLKPLVQAWPHVELHAAAVVLHEAALVDHGHLGALAHLTELFRGAHHDALVLDHTRAGNEEQLIGTAINVADLYVLGHAEVVTGE